MEKHVFAFFDWLRHKLHECPDCKSIARRKVTREAEFIQTTDGGFRVYETKVFCKDCGRLLNWWNEHCPLLSQEVLMMLY